MTLQIVGVSYLRPAGPGWQQRSTLRYLWRMGMKLPLVQSRLTLPSQSKREAGADATIAHF